MGRVTARRPVRRITATGDVHRPDTVAVEEPLQIMVGGRALTVTMRTPGSDIDLVHGFLLSEGIIDGRDDVVTARYCGGVDESGANTYNVVEVELSAAAAGRRVHRERAFVTTSACGVCGTSSIDDVQTISRHPVSDDPLVLTPDTLRSLPGALRDGQKVFDATGGLHAAGIFTGTGELLTIREDVGRHNAVDKAIGWAVRESLVPLTGHVLMVSGRASFELVQKAAVAGIPVLAAVSAPSSLAVDLAERSGVTLVGFLRERSMNVYTGGQRVTSG
ncbi:formate dehydrogenase accessory sulfurtransferase FdhD [Rhodococcus sp. D2-41]|uniref:formate dehydrogenase accessory sulfurtransferase FdhD n=1 Tax=Speluncibacter jeojiensis TaxID=2710754 RepID=UPI00240F94A0|nr:formate dehydrogenase accessory sulfurtransferase FdhD [Rhodococcus sp. D2-41]MDG3008570.1 formate dehydrogenase accessory sulfurtransferase FdhD [Rhodococcus sp. D2-41]